MDHSEVDYESNYPSYNSIIDSDVSEMISQWFGSEMIQSLFLPSHDEITNPNHSFPPYDLNYEGYENNTSMINNYQNAMSYFPVDQYTNQISESDEKLGQTNGKRKYENCGETCKNVSKKKPRHSISRKCQNREFKEGCNGESSSCSSEDETNGDLNTSFNNSKKNSNGKSKTAKGNATDPQSLYARKRREKINQRLKTLQNLVPNGTKVDISTMLEEAVRYVKFLQSQIKLLSHDELWMYAPVAYNGTNINLDLNF